jgi:hypothetical protein
LLKQQGFFVFGKNASKLQAEIVPVQVDQQDHKKGKVDEEPHQKPAFFAFIFYVCRHDYFFW